MLCLRRDMSRQFVLINVRSEQYIVHTVLPSSTLQIARFSCTWYTSTFSHAVCMTPNMYRCQNSVSSFQQHACLHVTANVVLQDSVCESGALQTLVGMLETQDADLKTSAIWALANMAYTASPAVQKALLQALPWRQVQELLQSTSQSIEVCQYGALWVIVPGCSSARENVHVSWQSCVKLHLHLVHVVQGR